MSSKVYNRGFLCALLEDNAEAWKYFRKRWPKAKELSTQGCHSLVFSLPGDRVLKITNECNEIRVARRVKREKPVGVVPVLAHGCWWYITPRCEVGEPGLVPDAPDVYHWDADPWERMHRGRNIMIYNGKPVYIDMDGLGWHADKRRVARKVAA